MKLMKNRNRKMRKMGTDPIFPRFGAMAWRAGPRLSGGLERRNRRASLAARSPKIVRSLHPQPRLGRSVQRGRQPERHLGADGRAAVDHARERDARFRRRAKSWSVPIFTASP